MLPNTLLEEVERLPEVIKERELSTSRRVVHWVLAMFNSHYQGLDRMALSSGWAPGSSNEYCDRLEEDCASFAYDMTDTAMKDPDLILGDAPEDQESSRPSLSMYHI
jgi:hypothetical protein